ncbi:hypothetical protein ACO0LM_17655 [Undibacterium sp. Di26W]|uniref:hypothetical protein n=1 Tax=Undibacterium sp. Di26W TaxID=3413035 RepID=UPI003BF0FB2E
MTKQHAQNNGGYDLEIEGFVEWLRFHPWSPLDVIKSRFSEKDFGGQDAELISVDGAIIENVALTHNCGFPQLQPGARKRGIRKNCHGKR